MRGCWLVKGVWRSLRFSNEMTTYVRHIVKVLELASFRVSSEQGMCGCPKIGYRLRKVCTMSKPFNLKCTRITIIARSVDQQRLAETTFRMYSNANSYRQHEYPHRPASDQSPSQYS